MSCNICKGKEKVESVPEHIKEMYPELKVYDHMCNTCIRKFIGMKLQDSQNQIIQEEKTENQQAKTKGYKYVYRFWIHPEGDDFSVEVFTKKRLSLRNISSKRKELCKKYHTNYVEEPKIICL